MIARTTLAAAFALAVAALASPLRAEPTALPAPTIFEPGVISGPANDGAPTFTPDGNTLYFERTGASWSVIVESHRTAGHWSKPRVASFSGPSSDQQPALSPDGRYLIYPSSRAQPVSAEKGAKLEMVTHLWRVDRTAQGWSAPVELPAQVNITGQMFKPTIAANGDLYFMTMEGPRGANPKWRLYESPMVNGAYAPAAPLSFSDGSFPDVDPYVAPDESYIIFSSRGRRGPDDDGHEHFNISFRTASGWGAATPMRYDGDTQGADDGEANVSPDGKTLYFTSSRSVAIHRMRTRAQMLEDYARLEAWDNSNNNVWTLPLAGYLHPPAPAG